MGGGEKIVEASRDRDTTGKCSSQTCDVVESDKSLGGELAMMLGEGGESAGAGREHCSVEKNETKESGG